AAFISAEIAWFREVVDQRFNMHAGKQQPCDVIARVAPPPLSGHSAPYRDVVRALDLGPAERLVLILAYLPHIRPHPLPPFLILHQSVQRRFTEFGGFTGHAHGGFLPTAETALFLLAGEDVEARLRFRTLFGAEHIFQRRNVLMLDRRQHDEPPLSAALAL